MSWRRSPVIGPASRGLPILLLAVALACWPRPGPAQEPLPQSAVQGPAPSGPLFVEATSESGLDFVHFNGMSGELYFSEIVGSGAALFDYDNDADLDLYLVQGSRLGAGKEPAGAQSAAPPGPLTDRLYRNDLELLPDGSRRLRFTDVTAQSGISESGYGMGVAAADYDNDGWTDLYVTNFGGSNQLLHNNGNGTFSDVTRASGTDDPLWSTSASFVDYDRDGWLDLFVVNYVNFSLATHKTCRMPSGRPEYCGPKSYKGEPDRLLRNRGDGTFQDVSAASGILGGYGAGLGVAAADYDGDGWPDLLVANDGESNFLWMNNRDGTFRDDALLAGCAVNRMGVAEANMGVDAGDIDNDGDEDLFITHLMSETNTLFVNDGSGMFEDRTARSRLGPLTRGLTGFGTAWLDFDNDRWLDLVVVNGSVTHLEPLLRAGDSFPLHQRKQLLRNLGDGTFADASAEGGAAFEHSEVGRGVAVGDLDNDGDIDLVVTNNNGPARVLLNQAGGRGSWLGLRLVGTAGKRDMLGARVALFPRQGPPLWRRARSDGSYCVANDSRVLFGLGASDAVDRVRVLWPSGRVEEWSATPVGRYTTLVEGTGQAVPGA